MALKLTPTVRKVIAYALLGLFAIVAFALIQGFIESTRRDSCRSNLSNRELIAAVIGHSAEGFQTGDNPNLSPELQELLKQAQAQQKNFLEFAQSQFNEPLEICERVGIESRIRLKNSKGVELVPAPSLSTTTTDPSH